MEIADAIPSSLTKIEYLTTFNAFIYGYIMTRFFSGWGKIINRREQVTFSIEHILWSVYAFFMLISMWWNSWLHIENIGSRSWTFYASLAPPFIMYLISSLYFPEIKANETLDLSKDSKFQRGQSAFLYLMLFTLMFIIEVIDDNLRQYIPYYLIGMVVCLIVFFVKKRLISRLSLLVGFIVLGLYIINMPSHYYSATNTINGFSFSEYLSTFFTFMYGFIVAKFLDGWTYFVNNRRSIRFNVDYILWTLLLFGVLIDFWWGLWNRSALASQNVGFFLMSLLVPIGFYILSSLLFQDSGMQQGQESFNKNYRLIFYCIIGIFFSDFWAGFIINNRELLHIENLFLLLPTLLSILALRKNTRWVLIIAWVLLIAHNLL